MTQAATRVYPNVVVKVEVAHGNGKAQDDKEADRHDISVAEGRVTLDAVARASAAEGGIYLQGNALLEHGDERGVHGLRGEDDGADVGGLKSNDKNKHNQVVQPAGTVVAGYLV